MKKLILVITRIIFLSFEQTRTAQFYIETGDGLELSLGSTVIAVNENQSAHPVKLNAIYGSFGKGISFGGGLGVFVHPNISVELDVRYTSGGSFEEKDIYPTYVVNTRYKGEMFLFAPAFIFNSEIGVFSPYVRAGFVMGFPSLNTISSGVYHNITVDYTDGTAFGFIGGAGVMVSVTSGMTLSTEISFTNISWRPETESYVNNETGESKITKLKESATEYDNNAIVPELPFGTLGVRIGILCSAQ